MARKSHGGNMSPHASLPRLAGVLLGLVAGAVAGGLLFLNACDYAPVLPLAITLLVLLMGWAQCQPRQDGLRS